MAIAIGTFDHGLDWETDFGYTQGLRAGDTIYISGQLAHDTAENLVGEGDFTAQIEATFDNVDRVLAHFGATRDQIVDDR